MSREDPRLRWWDQHPCACVLISREKKQCLFRRSTDCRHFTADERQSIARHHRLPSLPPSPSGRGAQASRQPKTATAKSNTR